MPKSKTRKQMAKEFGVSRRTFYRMLKKADLIPPPGMVTPEFQEKIYKHFGRPATHKQSEDAMDQQDMAN